MRNKRQRNIKFNRINDANTQKNDKNVNAIRKQSISCWFLFACHSSRFQVHFFVQSWRMLIRIFKQINILTVCTRQQFHEKDDCEQHEIRLEQANHKFAFWFHRSMSCNYHFENSEKFNAKTTTKSQKQHNTNSNWNSKFENCVRAWRQCVETDSQCLAA